MNKPIRTISILIGVLFAALLINQTYLQYWAAGSYDKDNRNRRVVDAEFSRERGALLVGRDPIAESKKVDDLYKYQRTYPKPLLYAGLTGYFAYGGAVTGLEKSQNDVLSGEDDRLFVNRMIDLLGDNGPKGGNIELTINAKAQKAAYDGLTSLPGNVKGAVVALEPSTGKILAMVTTPTFDPNKVATHDFGDNQKAYEKLDKDPDKPLLNRAVQMTLPPGSTFKILTAAAAIDSGKYNADSTVPGGSTYQLPLTHGESGLVDNEGRDCGTSEGGVPFRQAMENSCNTAFAQLAIGVGAAGMQKTAEKFGFNSTYFDQLQGTNGKSLTATSTFPTDMDKAQTGQAGFGQFDVRATPLQMAMVAAGIANHGAVMKPYVVDEIQSADSDTVSKAQPEQFSQAIKASTATEVTKLMVSTVDDGTASPAAIPGVKVAGKTGTAQSGQDNVAPYAWFTSFAPADNAKVAVAVMIESADIPRDDVAGGKWGGPIAKAVMEAVLG
ncbi:peptidoglycan D,D-transpeptidase FtsI family protein [Nocardioides sp. Kera G14]|uniref:peptidoglycan D,D-transpeptidase FtsI family protein n=1 Tax=Nocardioides sp. Kera G14 TaxID=2884264 RepID=UPI001D107412|nr:penicillin-binding protein 2 [Nocardioides sp. Kera G14]UDY23630.1 penicillin-binding protein 2 [Nocardioides sp. Kera G14]